jgi:hypothetical protein
MDRRGSQPQCLLLGLRIRQLGSHLFGSGIERRIFGFAARTQKKSRAKQQGDEHPIYLLAHKYPLANSITPCDGYSTHHFFGFNSHR